MMKKMKTRTKISNKDLEKAVLRSQRCQRNFDLSRQIPEEDLETIIHSATECPTKQNNSYYNLYVIQDREKIEAIYQATDTDPRGPDPVRKNPQVLANTLFIYTHNDLEKGHTWEQTSVIEGTADEGQARNVHEDRIQAIGISAGYVNLTSSMLGYQTGCCKCFDGQVIKKILGIKEKPLLLMGVGFKDPDKPRREDHMTGEIVRSFSKKIKVTRIS